MAKRYAVDLSVGLAGSVAASISVWLFHAPRVAAVIVVLFAAAVLGRVLYRAFL